MMHHSSEESVGRVVSEGATSRRSQERAKGRKRPLAPRWHRDVTATRRSRCTCLVLLLATGLYGMSVLAARQPAAPRLGAESLPAQVFRAETDLVALNVTVTDREGGAITGLRKEDFNVYEDGTEQTISLFANEQAPISWGLVLDRSGSMSDMMEDVYEAALHQIEEGTDEDEMFIVTFNDQVDVVSDFVTDTHRLENALLGLRAEGATALWDAVGFALQHIRTGRHRKKALVVVTDGEDNRSELPFRALIEGAERAETLVYPVGMMAPMGRWDRWIGRIGGGPPVRRELEKLAEVTGARAHFPTDIPACRQAMREIARELRHQYAIGYYPTNSKRDGKWRKIRVAVMAASSAVARTRTGYYAPLEDPGRR